MPSYSRAKSRMKTVMMKVKPKWKASYKSSSLEASQMKLFFEKGLVDQLGTCLSELVLEMDVPSLHG